METRAPAAPAAPAVAVVGEDALAAVHAVRREVFVVEQGVPEEEEWDSYDAGAVHLLATGPDGPVGTARLLHGGVARAKYGLPAGVAALGRVAVRAAARGTGLGAALVRAAEEQARLLGSTGVYLEAQVHAVPFYARLGYTAFGQEFDDGSGIMHRAMRRGLQPR
ncbi:GNAT family N-acetyltransferase [Streptomyces sp. NPDC059637]|uniref:GNAT family N-acetyltransferase n=1 Tax=Streptomyces sp. NPDC059637 TaxID=3347752 RepID=UPI0036C3D3AB